MKASELLADAKTLLEEKGWTTGYLARNKDGVCVAPFDVTATCFCAVGAIHRANQDGGIVEEVVWERVVEALRETIPGNRYAEAFGISLYNDSPNTSKADVLAWFDRAIEKAKEMEVGT